MKSDIERRRFVLIQGGVPEGVGPVTRLGLWERFPAISRGQWVMLLAGKAVLLASVIYIFVSRAH